MFNRILSLIKKELIQVFRNRITLMLILVSPIIQLLIFGYVAIIDVENVPMAVLDYSKTEESRRLISDFTSSGYFDIKFILQDDNEIENLLEHGKIDLALIIPRDFANRISNGEKTELMGIIDGSDSNTAITVGNYFNSISLGYSARIHGKLLQTGTQETAIAIESKPRVLFNPEMKSLYYIVPGIIAVLVLMLMVMLSSISIVRERERGTFEQLIVTPIRVGEMLIGKTVPFAILGYVSTCIITAIGIFWFRVPFRGSFLLLLATAGLFMVTALGLGVFVSSIAKTQQQALMMAIFVIVPQILLSGLLFPIESMPDIMQVLTMVIPTRYFLLIIRGIFLKGVGFSELLPEIMTLILFSVVIFSLAAFRFTRRAKI